MFAVDYDEFALMNLGISLLMPYIDRGYRLTYHLKSLVNRVVAFRWRDRLRWHSSTVALHREISDRLTPLLLSGQEAELSGPLEQPGYVTNSFDTPS
jgi:hypothetical protein